ncbi:MAG: shikimate dehydrogenase family protein [Candidatus Dormibacteria bacterium]
MSTRPLRLCLVGAGISRSPSPVMHQAAMQATGVEGTYELRDLRPEDIDAFVAELREGRYAGCNVTTPYKAVMAAKCDRLEGDADSLGVVNTITVRGRRLVGYTTDTDGFELALSQASMWPRQGATALLLGAGGAAAAVALALVGVPLLRLRIAARSAGAAESIAARLRHSGDIAGVSWDRDAIAATGAHSAIVVNATPVGLDDLPFDPRGLPRGCSVVDLRYGPRPVDVVSAAVETGHRASDGLEMLLHQGLLSFEIWTGKVAPPGAVRNALLRAVEA